MKCPKCGEEIEHVNLHSRVHQQGLLDGDRVTEYIHDEWDSPDAADCPRCFENIIDSVDLA